MADNYLGEDDDINGGEDENFSDGEYGAEIEDNYGLVKNPYKEGYGNKYDNTNNNYNEEDNEDEDDFGGNYQLEDDDIGNYGGSYGMDLGDEEEKPAKRADPDIKPPKSSEEKAADRYERELADLISLRTTSWDSSLSRMLKTFQEISVDESKNLNNNWTEVYEKLMEEKDSYQKFKNLAQLARDFNYAADIYGKIIINELCLENEKKTIKPVSIGGIAGGSKYIICGILFKFALDVYGIYGYNDDGAMKAAAHELRGVIQINSANVRDLHTPLMCLIDYKGFRLIAMSLINIDETSLVYGSADGGKTVHKSSHEACSAIKLLAKQLNLKKHQCGFERLFLCCDTEVHQIKKSFYVIDSARLFPPEAKLDKSVPMGKGEWLFRLLRPELVKSNPVPLSSDAFSTFQSKDPDRILHNNEVREATLRLIQSAFPNLVSQLEKVKSSDIYKQNLGKIFHSCGVNLRKMGEIRQLTKNNPLREMILCYMVIRACKELIHLQMRNTMWKLEVPRDEIFKEIHLNLLNNLFAGKDKEKSKLFWKILKDLIIEKYGINSLTDEEKGNNYHLRESIKSDLNLFRVYHICFPSVILNKELIDIIRYESDDDLIDITFVQGDIIELTSIVKQTNITYYAEAMALKSIAETKGLGNDAVERLKKRAAQLLSFAVNVSSNFDSLLQSALHNYQRKKLPKALSDFEAANQIDPNNSTARVYLGVVLARSDSKNYTEAAKQWEKALSLSPSSLDPFLTLSQSFVYGHQLFSGEDLNTLLQILFHSQPLIQRAIDLGKFKEVNLTGLSLIDDRIFIQLLQYNLFDHTEKLILRSVKITDKSVVLLSRLNHLRYLDLASIPNIPLSSILSLPKSIEVLVLPIGQFDISHLETVFGSSSLQRKFIFSNMYLSVKTHVHSPLFFDNHPNPSLITTREDRSEMSWFSSYPFSSPFSTIAEFHKDDEWGKFLIHEKEKRIFAVVEFAIFLFDFDQKTATKLIDTTHKKEIKFFSYSNQTFRTVDETGLLLEFNLQFEEIRRLKLVDPDHPSHTLEDFAFTPNHFITGQFGSPSLCIFDSSSGDFQRKIEIKGGDFIANIKAEGNKLVCRCIGQSGPDLFHIFDISTGEIIQQIILPDLYSIRDFKIDDQLLFVTNGATVVVFNLNGKIIHTIDQAVGAVNGIFFLNGLPLATSSSSNVFHTNFLHLSFLHSVELHRKCAIDSAEEVKKELQLHPVDLNAADFRGYTALHIAAMRGNMEILDLLIDSRANPKLQTLQKKTALDYAIEKSDENERNSFVENRWKDVISRLTHYTQNYWE